MNSARYCGRDFSATELRSIKRLIADNPESSRAALSRLVCDMLSWRRPDGRLKDMSCRVAMLRMQDDALIHLPLPRNGNNNGKSYLRRTQQAQPDPVPFITPVHSLTNLCIQPVSDLPSLERVYRSLPLFGLSAVAGRSDAVLRA